MHSTHYRKIIIVSTHRRQRQSWIRQSVGYDADTYPICHPPTTQTFCTWFSRPDHLPCSEFGSMCSSHHSAFHWQLSAPTCCKRIKHSSQHIEMLGISRFESDPKHPCMIWLLAVVRVQWFQGLCYQQESITTCHHCRICWWLWSVWGGSECNGHQLGLGSRWIFEEAEAMALTFV